MAWVQRLLRRFPRGRLDGCPSGLSPTTQPCSMPVTGAPARRTDEPAARGIARRRHVFSCTARGCVPNQSPRVLTHPRSLWHVRPVLALSSHLLSCLSMPPRIGAVQGWVANDFVRNLPATHRSTNGTVIPVNGLDNRCAHSERALVTLSTTNLAPTAPWGARYLPGHAFIAVTGSQLIEHLREMRLARGLALGTLDPADVVVALIRRPTSRSTIFSGKNASKRGPTEAVFGTFLPKYASERSGEPCAALAACRPGSVPPWQRAAPVVRRPIARRPNNAPPGNMPRYATISICSQEPSARGTSTVR